MTLGCEVRGTGKDDGEGVSAREGRLNFLAHLDLVVGGSELRV